MRTMVHRKRTARKTRWMCDSGGIYRRTNDGMTLGDWLYMLGFTVAMVCVLFFVWMSV